MRHPVDIFFSQTKDELQKKEETIKLWKTEEIYKSCL